MSFTASQLKDQFRLDVDDAEEPGSGDDSDSLWKDSEIYAYMDRAQKEFARLTEIFLDSTTVAITRSTITADDPWATLDSRIIDIVRATLLSNNRKLIVKKVEEMDQGYLSDDYGTVATSNWESNTGEPRYMIPNLEPNKARLVPTPVEDDTLVMTVVRYPKDDVKKASSVLEVTNTRYQYMLLDAMKWFAYEKQDADVFNLDISQRYQGKFFAQTAEVKNELRRRRRPGRGIVYGGL